MREHSFQQSKVIGDLGEAQLAAHFSKKFKIEDVNMELQKLGWDRIFTHRKTGARASVEFKTDTQASKTGNIFIESWSNRESSKRGWAFTSTAQWLYYYLPDISTVYICELTRLKIAVPQWEKKHKIVKPRNKKKATKKGPEEYYHSEGILVPVNEFEEICYEILVL